MGWHVDRTINVSVIVVCLLQFGGGVWWVSNLSNRVDNVAATNSEQTARLNAVEAVTAAQAVSNATQAAQMSAVRESLQELKTGIAETNRLLRERAVGAQP